VILLLFNCAFLPLWRWGVRELADSYQNKLTEMMGINKLEYDTEELLKEFDELGS